MLQGIASGLARVLFLLAVCIAIEQVAVIDRYSLRARIPGLLMTVAGTVGGLILVWPLNQLLSQAAPALQIPLWQWLKPLGAGGYVLQLLALIVIADFLAYWRHRMEHSRLWWPVHKVHHAPTELHAANNIGHPLQFLFSFLWITVPMSLFKISGPEVPISLGLSVLFLSFYIHSPIDIHFGPLRRVIVDNRFHRIHHSLEPRHFERNFGICFSFWDAMFGTAYYPKPDEWPAVGVAEVPAPKTVRDFLLLPFSPPKQIERSATDVARRRVPIGDRVHR